MKRFKFRLQVVLDQKISKEETLMRELGMIRYEEAQEIKKLDELVILEKQIIRLIKESMTGGINPAKTNQLINFKEATRDDIYAQQLTIDSVRERIDEKMAEVVVAMREKQVLESLKEKQEKAYIQSEDKKELDALDEMSSVRFARGM